MVIVFIVLAMLFFLYVEARILVSKNTSGFEKFYSVVCVALLEFYYFMQLLEHL